MSLLLQLVANGIVYSGIIVLASVGLSLVYSIGDFANFAHGDTMAVGAYGALAMVGVFGSVGLTATIWGFPIGFFIALVVGMAIAALVAVLTHKVVYERMDVGSIGMLITSIGIAFIYRSVIQIGFGPISQSFGVPRFGPIPVLQDALGVAVTRRDLLIVTVSLVLVIGLHFLLQYTTLGRKMRATADNRSLARVSGIRTDRVLISMWVIGAALAAAGGVFIGLNANVYPRMGFDILLLVFAAVILGGIGSVYGAMLGGFVIGMIHELTPLLQARMGIPIGTEYAPALAFLLMVAILLWRPSGILGGIGS
ncbi:Branched-chain amino acid ABC-type transport system, permease component [Halanaeroarchaeum sp. HSR-CO]|uniref:branched-chain amino acid ABC transporter permease n=1 Tax=Halanaeroarchaeum sp. HSR-CO TaxID=2866382 RepID=UPI00217EA7EA|nr:branched-chain amino acid ABC transporter permease [Halanaeroarchaeum sp. HSR-CO]UWG47448.1 Branched-chain amino acid ABC-type transport system, permease component [Halanaeroarchaeum sp. HSR-CO]